MNHLYDYKHFSILYLDDESMSLKYFKANFEERFNIITASTAAEAHALFDREKDNIAVVISDQRMPSETGVEFLQHVRQQKPKIIRMLATAYSDLDVAISAVNTGAIYKYITKPWDAHDLEITLMRAIEFFTIQGERDALLREKISALHRIMMTDRLISLGLLASGLSHHLRNALVAVRVFLDLAPAKLADERVSMEHLRNPDYWNDFYKTVQSQMIKATGLLDSLGSIPEAPPAHFDYNLKLSDLIQEFLVEKRQQPGWNNREVQVRNCEQEPVLRVDRKMILRLLDLLFDNLAYSASPQAPLLLAIQQDPANQGVTLDLSAPGLQLPEESVRHVFDPFYVRNEGPQDAGINLLICYFIVYHHGGTFTVSNQNGSHYKLDFPINPDRTPSEPSEEQFLNKVFATEYAWERLLIA